MATTKRTSDSAGPLVDAKKVKQEGVVTPMVDTDGNTIVVKNNNYWEFGTPDLAAYEYDVKKQPDGTVCPYLDTIKYWILYYFGSLFCYQSKASRFRSQQAVLGYLLKFVSSISF